MSERSSWDIPTPVEINGRAVTRGGLLRSVGLSLVFLALIGGIWLYRKFSI